jgi:hypothetical protein
VGEQGAEPARVEFLLKPAVEQFTCCLFVDSGRLEGFSCGYDAGAAVVPTYSSPFTFIGTIHKVTVDLAPELIVDDDP